MIPTRPQDVRHKIELFRLLTAIADDTDLSTSIYFKGGTCASMLGYLDRFSVDLDFDLDPKANIQTITAHLKKVFVSLKFEIKDQSQKVPEFFLRYESPKNSRNTIKVDAFGPVFKNNHYKPQFFPEIDRTLISQTIETMFANKLVAVLDRFEKHKSIAGRDIYDIHHFFYEGYSYESALITERTGLTPTVYLKKLSNFISEHVTETVIDQDLNPLLPDKTFQKIRKVLKTEVLTMLS